MKRFEKVAPVNGYEILTPDGFKPLAKLMLTEPFAECKLTTVGGKTLNCADKHIVITEDDREEFVDELFVGQRVQTIDGVDIVESVNSTGNKHRMYDVEVPDGHVYYADDILSHNTTTSMAYLLHQAITRSNITIAILANKGDTAAEVLDRIKFAYESLPWFLQVGVKTWNRRSVEFGNGSKIITAATSGSSIRGKSCVTGDTKVAIEISGELYYGMIEGFSGIIMSTDNQKYYAIYKTTNNKSGKEYIGFHGTYSYPLDYNPSGSIFVEGYLGSGKLLQQAIEKYGPESFSQELIDIFLTAEEAFEKERELVNEGWCSLDQTYNLVQGGPSPILCGPSNGFYGRTHSDEVKKMLSEICMGNKFHSTYYDNKIIDNRTGEVYLDYPTFTSKTGMSKSKLLFGIGMGHYSYSNEERQQRAIDRFRIYFHENGTRKSKERMSQLCSARFLGVPKTEPHKQKISDGVVAWIENNPEQHQARMKLINHNPEKIGKTAEKHKGMKRSEEAKLKMTLAKRGKPTHNKGKIRITDGAKVKYILPSEPIPAGWYR